MKITAIQLSNIKSFKYLPKTEFSSSINVLVGANNSGKTTILNSIYTLQKNGLFNIRDITIGEKSGHINLYFDGELQETGNNILNNNIYQFDLNNQTRIITNKNGQNFQLHNPSSNKEPFNLIYPFLSKRKVVSFSQDINLENVNTVEGNFTYLYSKIDNLVNPNFQPYNKQYVEACNNILGFEISTKAASGNGKIAVYYVQGNDHIPLQSMGEGVTNIVGLIADLCMAEDKIFLIEELENDIHPSALKSLLNLIIEKSDSNQFFVSTHSNIVMKFLGGVQGSKVFNITSDLSDPKRHNLFVSSLKEIPNDEYERKAILENLGYEFHDFGLWSAWLILEESSAEELIREWLIKWFVPNLKDKLRTFSANTITQVISKFADINRLFVFLHLEPVYKNKVWVIIDEGIEEAKIIEELKATYKKSGWKESNFSQFNEHDFERYYPNRFKDKVDMILSISNNQAKREAKRDLLKEVKTWIIDNEKVAKEEFKNSAASVISKLKLISSEISSF